MSRAQLPDSWASVPLSEVATLNERRSALWPDLNGSDVHFVPMSAVKEEFGGIDISQTRPFQDVRKGYTSFVAGDVLFAKITPCMENGKVAVVPELPCGVGFGSTEFLVLNPNDSALPAWIAHFLSQRSFRRFARASMTGSAGQLRVSSSWLAAAKIPVPPLSEQRRLLSKLDELLSDLDAGVAELKAAQKKLARYRQSLLKAAVEGDLTAEWRRQNPPKETGAQLLERLMSERREKWEAEQLSKFKGRGVAPAGGWQRRYSEPATPKPSELSALPANWTWATVEQLGEVQLGRQRSPDKVNGECPAKYIRAANITEGGVNLDDVLEMDFSPSERVTFALKAGDVLLTEASGSAEHVGRPAIWPAVDDLYCFQNTVIRFRPAGVSSEFSFLVYLACQKLGVFRRLSGGVGINHLSAGKFSALPVPLPPLDEQAAVVNQVEQLFARMAEQEAAISGALKQAAAQRQNILRAAFSGQLVPQDPNDEPASVLLERVRAGMPDRRATRSPRGRKAQAPA